MEKISRKSFVLGAAGALGLGLLTGCGGSEAGSRVGIGKLQQRRFQRSSRTPEGADLCRYHPLGLGVRCGGPGHGRFRYGGR